MPIGRPMGMLSAGQVGRVDRLAAGERRALGRPVAVDDPQRPRQPLIGHPDVTGRQRLAAREDLPHARERRGSRLHDLVEQARGQPERRHALCLDQTTQLVEVRRPVRRQHQPVRRAAGPPRSRRSTRRRPAGPVEGRPGRARTWHNRRRRGPGARSIGARSGRPSAPPSSRRCTSHRRGSSARPRGAGPRYPGGPVRMIPRR